MIDVVATDRPRPDPVERLLRGLPAWFGIESSIVDYVEAAERLPALVAVSDGVEVGVLLHPRHFPSSVEVHLMAVDPAHHRRGATVPRQGGLRGAKHRHSRGKVHRSGAALAADVYCGAPTRRQPELLRAR